MLTENFRDTVLFSPIQSGADCLKIIAGYATPAMASWHIAEISEVARTIDIVLIVGMCQYDGLTISAHQGFKNLMARNGTRGQSNFSCQYVIEGAPVHSKLYLWERQGQPFRAFLGSANYTQTAFSRFRREIIEECNPTEAQNYFNSLERQSIFCNHAEVEEHITLMRNHRILDTEESPVFALRGSDINHVTLSLLARGGETGTRSGLNWGQRDGREPNQGYIPLPVDIARTGFFPLEERVPEATRRMPKNPHFSVLTDDGVNLILRVEQQNDKAITTPLNNSLLGEYFRHRLGLANGAYVTAQDLQRYGRSDVTFYKLDDEQFFMDFSVQ